MPKSLKVAQSKQAISQCTTYAELVELRASFEIILRAKLNTQAEIWTAWLTAVQGVKL